MMYFLGSTNEEFNLRHDWNSLISHHPDLKMKHYSKDYFPHADTVVYEHIQKFLLCMRKH